MENVKNDNYKFLFHQSDLLQVSLDNDELLYIKYCLFFMLLNFPDRAYRISWCLGKLYDKTISEALCQAIELYFYKDDEVVTFLIKSITDTNQFEDLSERVLNLFKRIYNSGLPFSKDFVSTQLKFYKTNYGYVY